jgi:hypothetical protein
LILGDAHPDMLTFRNELVWVLAAQGDRRAAVGEYQRVLSARRQLLGEDHPDTAATRHCLDRLRHGEIVPAHHLV